MLTTEVLEYQQFILKTKFPKLKAFAESAGSLCCFYNKNQNPTISEIRTNGNIFGGSRADSCTYQEVKADGKCNRHVHMHMRVTENQRPY